MDLQKIGGDASENSSVTAEGSVSSISIDITSVGQIPAQAATEQLSGKYFIFSSICTI